MNVQHYTNSELLIESNWSMIYRVVNSKSKATYILKTPNKKLDNHKAKSTYQSEFEIGSQLDSKYFIQYYENGLHEGIPYLICEDIGGCALSQIIPAKGFDIDQFFEYAITIVNAIATLHQKKIIHKDINPSNLIINKKSGVLKVTDFGASSNFTKEFNNGNADLNQATLAYLSPEQTGRLNRFVNYKTDFYSLGITFFQLLTGRLPYTSEDPSELIYQHIAAAVPHIKEINPSLPTQLDEIVAKLMSKNPEGRYNSAIGLLSDLGKCRDQWNETHNISLFPLAENDVSEEFSIREKIYGREAELKEVKGYFQRAVEGRFTVCYIEGVSGIGKSAFVAELYKDIVKEKGNYGIGKFDQFKRNIPYSALIQALNQVIQQILKESPEKVERWKHILKESLGNNSGLLFSVFPDLKLIIGDVELVEIDDQALAKNRFVLAFKNLIKGFSQEDAPLVIFLDDLQWIDSATLLLFTDFFNSVNIQEKNYTFIIGAYRDNEVGTDHPLAMVLHDFEQRGFPKRSIKLEALSVSAINQLCADALERNLEDTKELVNLIYTKTGGSPFFVKQFLENLYERGFIYLNRSNKNWTWQIDKVKAAGFTDNVVDLIKEKLHKLDDRVISVLKIASCFGQQFDIVDIVNISSLHRPEVVTALEKSMEEDIIIKFYKNANEEYRFQHDRIQNAAYSLITEDELNQYDLRIGAYLLQEKNTDENDHRKLFEGLEHINRVESFVKDQTLRAKLAQYNLDAANIGRQSNAYLASYTFAKKGISFLDVNPWKNQTQLSKDLHLIGAQSAYFLGDYENMHELTKTALPNIVNPIVRATFHEVITYAYASKREWNETVEEALKGLEILGIKLPRNPSTVHVLKHLASFFITLRMRKPEDLIELQELKDPKIEAAIKLLISAVSAAYLTNQNLFAILFTEMARLSAKYGNCKYSAFAYTGFGVFLGGALGFIDYGYRYGEVAKKVFEKYPSDELMAKLYFSLYGFIQNWKIDVKEIYPKFREGFQVGSQVGENEYAAWCLSMRTGMSTLSGENLEKLEVELIAAVKYSENLKQIEIISQGFLDYCLWWQGKGTDQRNPLLPEFRDSIAELLIEEKFWTALAEHDMIYGSMYFYYGEYEKAWFYLSRGWKHHESLVGLFYFAQLVYFRAWTAIKLQQINSKRFSNKQLKTIINDFKKWAEHSVPNHGHKLTMFDAELAVLNRDVATAMNLFDTAITQAEKSDHPNDEAIFSELAAQHYEQWQKKAFRDIYLQKAYNAYLKWGATRKLRDFEKKYPGIKFQTINVNNPDDSSGSAYTDNLFTRIDIDSIVKASQAISSEVQIDALMTSLLKILTETAGAQRVIILLNTKGKFFVEAMKESGTEVQLCKIPLDEFINIPFSIIHYIEKTRNVVLLENAFQKGDFTRDPFIISSQEKSVLALPIVRQGILEGIIYMNNNLATGVFTEERAEMLTALSAQMAISLENANYINSIQQLNKSYDRFVPKEFIKMLAKDSILDVAAGDQKIKEMIILFADIRNFTTFCETIPANETFSVLNEYLDYVAPAIQKHGGVIDKFMGDGIMALFENDADNALQAAIEMQNQLHLFNRKRIAANELPMQIGIGLHIGTVTLGTVGTENRLSTTVIGDPVNLASRLEAYSKINKAFIQLSEDLASKLQNPSKFNLRQVGKLLAKGKSNKVVLLEEYTCLNEVVREKIKMNIEQFNKAMEAYDRKQIIEAQEIFKEYLKVIPEDEVAQSYFQQCNLELKN